MTRSRIMAGAIALVLSFGGWSYAGTAADPEVADPAGDAMWIHEGGANADWADITGVWFQTVGGTNASTGIRVHLGVLGAASAADRDAELSLSWTMESCVVDLRILRTDSGDAWGPPGATMNYGCEEDGTKVDAAGLFTVQRMPWMDPVPIPMIDSGTEIVIDVPFSAFSQGAAAGRFRDGVVIEHARATSRVLADLRPDGQMLSIDETGCPMVRADDRPCDARPYVVGA